MWHMTGDRWQVTCDRWHVTGDTWHVTHGVGWPFSKKISSLALTVWELWSFEHLDEKAHGLTELINQSMNHKAVCRTALATRGLLKTPSNPWISMVWLENPSASGEQSYFFHMMMILCNRVLLQPNATEICSCSVCWSAMTLFLVALTVMESLQLIFDCEGETWKTCHFQRLMILLPYDDGAQSDCNTVTTWLGKDFACVSNEWWWCAS